MISDRVQADDLPTINMTPMVDIVLCLLVFFMAATKLYDWDENEFAIRVPEVAAAAPLTAAPEALALVVVAPGKVQMTDRTVDLAALETALREAKGRYADQAVTIRADAKLPYQDVADVLSTCHAAGIHNIDLPVRPRETDTR